MRIARLAVLTLALVSACLAQLPRFTIGEALRQYDIPTTGLPAATLQANTTFANLDEPHRYAIAYYLSQSGTTKAPLWIRAFNKKTKTWIFRKYAKIGATVLPNLKANCLGPVESIKSIAGYFALDTHLSPSAGCTIILTPKLDLKRAFYGWIAANTSNRALLQHSEIHFAPTHPVELSVYDFATDQLQQIYPPKQSTIRDAYKKVLQDNLSIDWCQQNNSHCDPQLFGADMGDVAANDQTQAFAFDIRFRPEGYGPHAESAAGVRNVVYVFRRRNSSWDFREFPKDEFPMKLDEAVKPDNLRQLFSDKTP